MAEKGLVLQKVTVGEHSVKGECMAGLDQEAANIADGHLPPEVTLKYLNHSTIQHHNLVQGCV